MSIYQPDSMFKSAMTSNKIYSEAINTEASFEIGPLIQSAGHQWMFRVRLIYSGVSVVCDGTRMKWSIEDKGKKTMHSLNKLIYYGYNHLIDELGSHCTRPCTDTLRLKLGTAVLRDESDKKSPYPITELLGLPDEVTGDCNTRLLDGNMASPYFVTCSLATKTEVVTDELGGSMRVCHTYMPAKMDSTMHEEISEWMPVADDYPEEGERVFVHVFSRLGTLIRFSAGSSVTVELKRV